MMWRFSPSKSELEARPPGTRPPGTRPPGARPRLVGIPKLFLGGAALLALAGCFGGGMSDGMSGGMQLTAEETTATPPEESGPIKFVWEGDDGETTTLISTTTSTTGTPTETFIARQKIAEHRRKPDFAHRILPSINPNGSENTPPQAGRGQQIRLIPLDNGLIIRKRAEEAAGDVTVLGVTQE